MKDSLYESDGIGKFHLGMGCHGLVLVYEGWENLNFPELYVLETSVPFRSCVRVLKYMEVIDIGASSVCDYIDTLLLLLGVCH